MMKRQIECLTRLLTLNGSLDDIVDFLIEESIMDASELPYLKREVDIPKQIWKLVNDAKQKQKVMLFDFEWQILPVERIKITIVSDRSNRIFSYNHV